MEERQPRLDLRLVASWLLIGIPQSVRAGTVKATDVLTGDDFCARQKLESQR